VVNPALDRAGRAPIPTFLFAPQVKHARTITILFLKEKKVLQQGKQVLEQQKDLLFKAAAGSLPTYGISDKGV